MDCKREQVEKNTPRRRGTEEVKREKKNLKLFKNRGGGSGHSTKVNRAEKISTGLSSIMVEKGKKGENSGGGGHETSFPENK